MEQVISDSEISSCLELENKRQETERAELEAVERRMNDIIGGAMQEYEEIVAEKDVLHLELQNELTSVNNCNVALAAAQESVRQQLLDMLELQSQLTNVNVETVNLLSSLQELREQNHATLRADPIYALVQEERYLQQQLDEMGIYVYPPTGSDERYPGTGTGYPN